MVAGIGMLTRSHAEVDVKLSGGIGPGEESVE